MSQENASWQQQDSFLAEQIEKTVGQIRRVEWFATGAQLATLALGGILTGIVLDHWVFSGGLSVRARLLFGSGLLALLLVTLLRRAVPLLRKRVNPLFAASVLEGGPGKGKNFIINWFLLRKRADDLQADSTDLKHVILQGVVRQANEEVKELPEESPVDHSAIIRWGIVFTCLSAVLAVYAIVSPKNPLTSFERLMFPTAKIEAPLSVQFHEIKPGDVSVFAGDTVVVEAEIAGVGKKPVFFSWTTDDRRLVDRTLPMEHVSGRFYKILFPAGPEGLTEPISYRVLVGEPGKSENYSPSFRISVRQPMAIAVERLRIDFPAYTRHAPVIVENSGDIRALWGSTVEVVAKANAPLKSAFILPRQKEEWARTMLLDSSNPLRARLVFVPQKENGVPSQEPTFSDQDTWSILCHDEQGNPNRSPAVHSIEMYEDLPPNVTWEATPNGRPEIPLNSSFSVKVRVEDPDFGLTAVSLNVSPRLQQDNRQAALLLRDDEIKTIELLAPDPEKTLSGEHVLSGTIRPSELKLMPGLEYDYRVVACDGKTPKPNRTSSSAKSFVVTEPSAQKIDQESQPDQKKDDSAGQESSNQKKDDSAGQEGNNQEKDDSAGQESSNQKKDDPAGQEGNNQKKDDSAGQESNNQKKDDPAGQEGNNQKKDDSGNSEQSSDKQSADTSKDNKAPKEQSGKDGQGSQSQTPSSESEDDKSSQNQASEGNSSQGKDEQGGSSSQNRSEGQNGKPDQGPNGGNSSEGQSQESGTQPDNQSTGQQGSSQSDSTGKRPPSSDSTPDNGRPDKNSEKSPGQETPSSTPGESNSQSGNQSGDQSANQSGNQGKDHSKSRPDSSNPIDPDANAGDAFEKIMEHMEKTGHGTPSVNPQTAKPELSEPPTGNESGDNQTGKGVKGPAPDELPKGLERNHGDVEPDSKNFMTKQGQGKLPENERELSRDSKVVDDPDHPVQGEKVDGPADNLPAVKTKNSKQLGKKPEPIAPSDVQNKQSPSSSDKETLDANELGINPDQLRDGKNKTDSLLTTPSQEKKQGNQTGQAGSDDPPKKEQGKDSSGNQSTPGGTTPNQSPHGSSESEQIGGGHAPSSSTQEQSTTVSADDPHIQYTQQATNLVLEYLEDQVKDKIDPALLNELGWTEDQLKQFLKKWKSMKENAKKTGATQDDRVSYLESLRNIGLRNWKESQKHAGGTLSDKEQRSNTEDTRFAPPASFQDRFRAFNRGVSKEQNR